jgi:translation initiation factor IF-3
LNLCLITLREGEKKISIRPEHRINERIRTEKVRLIEENGENVGVVTIQEALRRADDAGLDLVEIAPNTDPPVCKIVNYSKFLYEKEKKEREARRAQTKIEIKEIRLRPKTGGNHRDFKVRDARKWLLSGIKVRVTVRFRGREITYPELALEDLREIAESLQDVAEIEQAPNMEGKTMYMMLTAKRPSAGAPKLNEKEADAKLEVKASTKIEPKETVAVAKAEPKASTKIEPKETVVAAKAEPKASTKIEPKETVVAAKAEPKASTKVEPKETVVAVKAEPKASTKVEPKETVVAVKVEPKA